MLSIHFIISILFMQIKRVFISCLYYDSITMTITKKCSCVGDHQDFFLVGVQAAPVISAPIMGKYPLCGQYPTTALAGGSLPVYCNDSIPPGRFVFIQQPANGTGQLNICEVEIFCEYYENYYDAAFIHERSQI